MTIEPGLIQSLRDAKHVVAFTGAGISAESGIPTFRDPLTGLWARYEATELATPEAFRRDPDLVWGWYEWRRAMVRRAQPNPAHLALARIANHVPTFTLVTQNVDDLHERAGSRDPSHLHGEISRPYCEACSRVFTLPDQMTGLPDGGRRERPPICLACGGRVRPGVVWFGESLPQAPWQAALQATRKCDVFLCIGTSAVVQPAASLIEIANESGACTVQVNPNQTEVDASVTHVLKGKAGDLLPQLVDSTWGNSS